MFTLRISLALSAAAMVVLSDILPAAERPRPPNLKLGSGIDMRKGPITDAGAVSARSFTLLGTGETIISWDDAICNAGGYTPVSKLLYSTSSYLVTVTGYTDSAWANIKIPPYIGGYPVVALGAGAPIRNQSRIKSLVLPPTLRNIGAGALAQAPLLSLVIPASVTNIGASAFFTPALYFEGPQPTGCATMTYLGTGKAYYLAGYRYPATLGGTPTYLYGPAQTANSLILSGTNLYFISSAGITNLVNVTPLP